MSREVEPEQPIKPDLYMPPVGEAIPLLGGQGYDAVREANRAYRIGKGVTFAMGAGAFASGVFFDAPDAVTIGLLVGSAVSYGAGLGVAATKLARAS